MSYVTIYEVQANGDVVQAGEGSNNHTFAPIVWDVLGYKYKYMNKVAHPYSLMDPGLEKMWKAWPDPKMGRLEQVLLGATFDFVWIKRDLLPEVIEACEWFLREHVEKPHKYTDYKGETTDQRYDARTLVGDPEQMAGFKPGEVITLKESQRRKGIIKVLKGIYEDPLARGAAFNCCSAIESFWRVEDVPFSCENEDGTIQHNKDEDCQVGQDGCCDVCGATHTIVCSECGSKAFHKEGCSEFEWDSRPWNVDKDKIQPRGAYKGKKAWELSEGLLHKEISEP